MRLVVKIGFSISASSFKGAGVITDEILSPYT
jgi:hypothetical protein